MASTTNKGGASALPTFRDPGSLLQSQEGAKMATAYKQGAQALPIARAFLELGGTLMLNPEGRLETGGGLRWALPDISAKEARKSFTVERRLYRRLRDPRFATSVRCLVLQDGEQRPDGWLVMEGRR